MLIQTDIDRKNKRLHINMAGVVKHPVVNGKLRIVAVFSYENSTKRRFPMEAVCFQGKEECFFGVKKTIELDSVFAEMPKEASETMVSVRFEYCDADGVWHSIGETLKMEADLFVKKEQSSGVFRCYRKAMYAIGTCMLPWFLADGYFVQKGYKTSCYRKEVFAGKKGIFYHAHDIVHSLSGYGYSRREKNTHYFAKKYMKYSQKAGNPQNILFLSERPKETGGNIDCVEQELSKRGIAYREIIDTRLIDRQDKKTIRRIAKEAAMAKVIVLEDFYPQINQTVLSKKTMLLQLWHACGAFKMFGLSELGKDGSLPQNTKNHRNYSAAFTSGENMVPFYSEAFGMNPKNTLPLGVPRTDVFFDTEYKEQVRKRLYEKYPMLKGKKVVLFAPTFRGGGNKDGYYPMDRFRIDRYMEAVPEDTVLIVKNHPFVKEAFTWSEMYADRVLDLTGKENINDVLFITSLLITDYSSSIFEASLLEIPMLFYVFDLEEYVASRDFYFDFTNFVPGERAVTFEELIVHSVKCLGETGSYTNERLQEFRNYFLDALDGGSTERIADYIVSIVS